MERGVGRSDLCPAVPVEATMSHIRTRRVEAGVCGGGGGWGGLINQFSVTFREVRVCE